MSSSGGTIQLTTDGHTKAEVASLLASYATTSAMTAAIATSASASYLDAVSFTNTAIANNALQNSGAGTVDLLYNEALRGLSFSGPLGHA